MSLHQWQHESKLFQLRDTVSQKSKFLPTVKQFKIRKGRGINQRDVSSFFISQFVAVAILHPWVMVPETNCSSW